MRKADITEAPPENEMVSRVSAQPGRTRGCMEGVAGGVLVTTGARPGAILTTVMTNPKFQCLHSPIVGICSGLKEQ